MQAKNSHFYDEDDDDNNNNNNNPTAAHDICPFNVFKQQITLKVASYKSAKIDTSNEVIQMIQYNIISKNYVTKLCTIIMG